MTRPPLAGKHPMFAATLARYAANVENRRGGVSVLLVEDEYIVRDAIATFLRARGAHVFATASAGYALKFLERHKVDVLVSDIRMPERDGFWLIREVRSRPTLRWIPAIAFTSLERDDTQRILDAGFSAHVGKANPHALWLTIQNLQRQAAG